MKIQYLVTIDMEEDARGDSTYTEKEIDGLAEAGRNAILNALKNTQANGFDHPRAAETSINIDSVTLLGTSGGDETMYKCDNCGYEAVEGALPDAQDIPQRVDAGGIYTDKECLECGALIYPKHHIIPA